MGVEPLFSSCCGLSDSLAMGTGSRGTKSQIVTEISCSLRRSDFLDLAEKGHLWVVREVTGLGSTATCLGPVEPSISRTVWAVHDNA